MAAADLKQGWTGKGAGFGAGALDRLRSIDFFNTARFFFLSTHQNAFFFPPPQILNTASLRSKHFVTVSDSGGAADDVALPGLLGVGRVELAIQEEKDAAAATKGGDDGEGLEEVGGAEGSGQVRPRAALFVTDIGSEAVVLVDGEPLAKRQRRRLRPGSVLSFRRLQEQQGGEGGEEECEFELFRNEVAHA